MATDADRNRQTIEKDYDLACRLARAHMEGLIPEGEKPAVIAFINQSFAAKQRADLERRRGRRERDARTRATPDRGAARDR
ncbi:hypothetical protein [Nocardia paucivorans]|uniref:hypothetical protein n=1 Tax=Nocardia paucivorans TaxID=114259 RepID=UPI0002EB94CF|nr:hypothetical protein [Nocardia paucivorans]